MKILPERVTVLANTEKCELTVVMDGFRMTLSGDEARALNHALAQGMKQLFPDQPASYPAAVHSGKAAAQDGDGPGLPEFRPIEATKSKSDHNDVADARRPLSA